MTVKELIKELSKFPDHLLVCYPSEDSCTDYTSVSNVSRGVNELDGIALLDNYVEED